LETHFESAIITKDDKTIAVVSVNPGIFNDSFNATMIIKALLPVFNRIPVVLMTKDSQGSPAYFGRSDLVLFLETVDITKASWNQVTADVDLSNTCPVKEVED